MSNPGYRTTEFWLTLAGEVVSALVVSGVFESDQALKILALAGAIIARVAYTIARSKTKTEPVGGSNG